MNMIENKQRILKLIKEAEEQFAGTGKTLLDIEDYVAEYLTANGAFVPPCKVGDVVYQPSYKFTKCSAHNYTPKHCCDESFCCGCESECDSEAEPYIYEGKVISVRITKNQIYLSVVFKEKFDSSSFILGKTVFLTREEAEAKLRGWSSGR